MAMKFRLVNRDVRVRACEAIRDAPDKAEVTIKGPSRTLDQNALMWACLTDVARARPKGRVHTPAVWKQVFVHALEFEEMQFADPLDEGGEPFPLGFSTSNMTISQMRDLIEFIYSWGTQNGVQFTDPPPKGMVA